MKKMSQAPYYSISTLFTSARMGIGATSVVYMLQNGCSLGDIALIKTIQGLVVFFSEVPTGLIADTLGRRASLFLSAACACLSFFIFIVGNHVSHFIVAEIFNALCISFWSGAFEALAIEGIKAKERPGNFLEYFFAKIAAYSAAGTMIGGLIGGLLADINPVYPFIFSISLMISTMILIYQFTQETVAIRKLTSTQIRIVARIKNVLKQMATHKKNAFKFALSNRIIRDFFIIQILIQFSMQPVFHYWQPYFQSLSSSITTTQLGIIFFLYVGSQLVFSAVSSYLFKRNLISISTLNSFNGLLVLFTFMGLCVSPSFILSAGLFIILQGSINSLRNTIGATFNRFVDDKERATVLSSVSFISRLGMLAHLGILQITATWLPIRYAYGFSFLAFLILIPYLLRWNTAKNSMTYA